MALEGSIKEFGLADILQLIYYQKKTGILRIEGPFDVVSVYFKDGNIVGTKSGKRPEELRVGRILVKKGLISEEDLEAALREQKERGLRLGDILVEKNLVDEDIIKETLTRQITDQLVHLFSWKEGNYVFRPKEIKTDSIVEISIDTQHLLMEGLRIVDEWSVVEGEITIDTIFKKTEKAQQDEHARDLDDKELYILSFIDGETDVGTITELAALDDLEVSKALIKLKDRGLIEEIEEARAVEPEIPRPVVKPISRALLIPFLIIMLTVVMFFPLKTFLIDLINSENILLTGNRLDSLRLEIEWYRINNNYYPVKFDPGEDPWQENIIYKKTGTNRYILFSKGPDRKANTPDDIY